MWFLIGNWTAHWFSRNLITGGRIADADVTSSREHGTSATWSGTPATRWISCMCVCVCMFVPECVYVCVCEFCCSLLQCVAVCCSALQCVFICVCMFVSGCVRTCVREFLCIRTIDRYMKQPIWRSLLPFGVSFLYSQISINDLVLWVSFTTFRWKETKEFKARHACIQVRL